MTRTTPLRVECRRGVAAAELAIVLPLLIILVGGCIDFGRFSHVNITVTNAARTGAEFGSMHPCTTATYSLWQEHVRQAVVDEMAGLARFDPARLSVTITRVTVGDHPRVEVDVSYPFEMVGDWSGLPKQLTLRRVVSMPAARP